MTNADAEYAALAPDYDRQWAAYNAATARRTLGTFFAVESGPSLLLDVGCGTGSMLAGLIGSPHVGAGLDRSAEMLAVARGRLPGATLVRGDAAALPFPDATFDAVVTNSVLHYADDPAACVRELVRVVKPGGPVVWTDWDGGSLGTRAVVAWLRLTGRPLGRVLSAEGMTAIMEDAGLKQVRTTRWRHGRLWDLATAHGLKTG